MTDQRSDMEFLNSRPEFRRFLWRVIQRAGILTPATDGSEGRHLAYAEGRRNLGLEILDDAETGQPVAHPESLPILTLIQALREETQQQPQETRRGKYDRTAELDQPDDD